MPDDELLKRITRNPAIMGGQPVIRGTRLTVGFIMNVLSHGTTLEDVLDEYAGLTREDIQACQLYAAGSKDGGLT